MANSKWPSVEKPVGKSGGGGWPSVESNVTGKRSTPDSAKTATLARNHPLEGKEFQRKRGQ